MKQSWARILPLLFLVISSFHLAPGSGPRLYAAFDRSGLHMLEADLVPAGELPGGFFYQPGQYSGVALFRDHVYAAVPEGIAVFQAAGLGRLEPAGQVAAESLRGLAVAELGDSLFALGAPGGPELVTVDLLYPGGDGPRCGRISLPGAEVQETWVEWQGVMTGKRGYVAAGPGGLYVLNLNDPLNPAVLWHSNLAEDARDVEAAPLTSTFSEYGAFVADGANGLRLLKIDELNGVITAGYTVDTPGDARGVSLHFPNPLLRAKPDYAYVGDGEAGLAVVDLKAKAIVRTIDLNEEAGSSIVYEGRLYLALGGGLAAFDLADPAAPRRLATIVLPGEAVALAASRGRLYAAAGAEGLWVIPTRHLYLPQVVRRAGSVK